MADARRFFELIVDDDDVLLLNSASHEGGGTSQVRATASIILSAFVFEALFGEHTRYVHLFLYGLRDAQKFQRHSMCYLKNVMLRMLRMLYLCFEADDCRLIAHKDLV